MSSSPSGVIASSLGSMGGTTLDALGVEEDGSLGVGVSSVMVAFCIGLQLVQGCYRRL
jgi:hypothetical protein